MSDIELIESSLKGLPLENCCICDTPTKYWYEINDVALCEECAKTIKEKDIPTKKEWCTAYYKKHGR